MLLHEIPELRNYPNVSSSVENHLSMQFADVRSMLRLPLPEQGIDGTEYGGCNFAVTAVLCNLISGISVTIFMPSNLGGGERIESGETYRQLIENFYPWALTEDRQETVRVLYDIIRNPFAHSLGVHEQSDYIVNVQKSPLTSEQIEDLERAQTQPSGLPPGLSRSGQCWTLDARGFYKDAFHMFWNLARDEQQMNEAEERFSAGLIIWRDWRSRRSLWNRQARTIISE